MNDPTSPRLPIEIWIDGECAVCRQSQKWCAARDHGNRLAFRDLHHDDDPPADRPQLLEAVHIRAADGSVVAGFEAWRQILLELDGWRWLARFAGLPGIRTLGSLVYSWVAANRHRLVRQAD